MRTLYTILGRQFDHLVLYGTANVGNEADMFKTCLDFSFRVARILNEYQCGGLDLAAKLVEEMKINIHVV